MLADTAYCNSNANRFAGTDRLTMICHGEKGTLIENEPAYDIFSGTYDSDTAWLCAIEGLWNARMKMERLAAEHPGKYFVFCVKEQIVVATIDTTGQQELSAQDHAA